MIDDPNDAVLVEGSSFLPTRSNVTPKKKERCPDDGVPILWRLDEPLMGPVWVVLGAGPSLRCIVSLEPRLLVPCIYRTARFHND